MITAFSKLGGLLALFKIGSLLNYMHMRWFNKEINQVIAQSKIVPEKDKDEEDEEGKKPKKKTLVNKIYSIEYFNKMIERL